MRVGIAPRNTVSGTPGSPSASPTPRKTANMEAVWAVPEANR